MVPRPSAGNRVLVTIEKCRNSGTMYFSSAVLQGTHLNRKSDFQLHAKTTAEKVGYFPHNHHFVRNSAMSEALETQNKISWERFFTSSFGTIVTIGSLLFLGIKLLAVSDGNVQTASFLLFHADKVPLILGAYLTGLPFLCVILYCILLRGYLIYPSSRGFLQEQSLLVLVSVAGFAAIAIADWKAWIAGAFVASTFLDIHIPSRFLSKKRREERNLPPKSERRIFAPNYPFGALGALLSVIFFSSLFSSNVQWFPNECIKLKEGEFVSATVLNVDPSFTYLLKDPHKTPLILISSKIEVRTVGVNGRENACRIATKGSKKSHDVLTVPQSIKGSK